MVITERQRTIKRLRAMQREQYPYEYDIVITMRVRAKEDLPEEDVVKSVDTTLWGIELMGLAETCLTDLRIDGKKKEMGG